MGNNVNLNISGSVEVGSGDGNTEMSGGNKGKYPIRKRRENTNGE